MYNQGENMSEEYYEERVLRFRVVKQYTEEHPHYEERKIRDGQIRSVSKKLTHLEKDFSTRRETQ